MHLGQSVQLRLTFFPPATLLSSSIRPLLEFSRYDFYKHRAESGTAKVTLIKLSSFRLAPRRDAPADGALEASSPSGGGGAQAPRAAARARLT